VHPRGALWNNHGQRFGPKFGRKHVDVTTAMEIKHGPVRSGGGEEKKDGEETLIAIEGSEGGDYELAPASAKASRSSNHPELQPVSQQTFVRRQRRPCRPELRRVNAFLRTS
jgi:hypothetical protein